MGTPTTAKVVHCKREHYDVYIGRGSGWGNPFKIGVHGDRDEVIALYKMYLDALIMEGDIDLSPLKGKVLGCWCAPKACHGDYLLELANGGEW